MKTLCMRSQTLKIFCLTFHPVRSGTEGSVKIDAPRLKYMSFSDMIVVKNLNSLLKIDIDTDFNIKPLILLSEVLSKRDIIHEFLTGIASVTHDYLSAYSRGILCDTLTFIFILKDSHL